MLFDGEQKGKIHRDVDGGNQENYWLDTINAQLVRDSGGPATFSNRSNGNANHGDGGKSRIYDYKDDVEVQATINVEGGIDTKVESR